MTDAALHAPRATPAGPARPNLDGGFDHLWGLVGSPVERKAPLALAESVPGVSRVCDETISAY